MRIIWMTLLLVLSGQVRAAPTELENVRIWAAPDNTRIVFDVSGPVEHRITKLEDPKRIVIDIHDNHLNTTLPQPAAGDNFLYQLRSGIQEKNDMRLVLDIKQDVEINSFLLPPNQRYGHRLVVDLSGTASRQDLQTVSINKTPSGNRDVIIALDAGHGGDDPGARGPGGAWEKDLVLQIARQLAVMIDKERGMRALMVREGDYFMPLRKRIEKARQNKADLFVSIHADAFRDSRVRGASVYILSERGASSEAARWLAERENASDLIGGVSLDVEDDTLASVLLDLSQTASLEMSIDVADRVLAALKNLGNIHKRQVQSAGFAVLKSPDIPSILVETAYISNPVEEKKLRDPDYQQHLAGAVLQGLRGYFLDNAPAGTLFATMAKRKHIIARGDTLSTIAAQYHVSTEKLREHNGLKSDLVRVGQVLSIPGEGDG
ncbi:MAG: N-acetylmuramoyl-L-alanine amidase [Gammaproteobacteria bacterium]